MLVRGNTKKMAREKAEIRINLKSNFKVITAGLRLNNYIY